MNCYNPSALTWNASNPVKARQYPGGFLPSISLSTQPFTATFPQFAISFIKDRLHERTSSYDNLTLFMMQHSQQAFSKIWNDPEEDIWDDL